MKVNDLKKELKKLFKSMDFIGDFLKEKDLKKKELDMYFNIYQQLGLAWEFLGLQCAHDEGYKKTKDKKEACKICGKIKDVDEFYYLIPRKGRKKIGVKLKPNSDKIFKNKKAAQIDYDFIDFHGVKLKVDVCNSYKSTLPGNNINIAADRIVELKEHGIEFWIDSHLMRINTNKQKGKKTFGGFPWELKKSELKNFPVIFDFDEDHHFLGLTILR